MLSPNPRWRFPRRVAGDALADCRDGRGHAAPYDGQGEVCEQRAGPRLTRRPGVPQIRAQAAGGTAQAAALLAAASWPRISAAY